MKGYAQSDERKSKRFEKKLKRNAGANGSGLNAAGDYIPEGQLIETVVEETLQTLHVKLERFVKGSDCL